MAKAYYRLDEVDASGAVVFSYNIFSEGLDVDWQVSAGSNTNLRWAELNTELNLRASTDASFDIAVTFFLSNVVGRLNVAGTVMTPRNLESVIRISNYRYAAATNKLVLHMAVAHGQTQFSASGNKISTGQNLEQIYVQLASNCRVSSDPEAMDGDEKSVTLGSWSSNSTVKSIIGSSAFNSYLQSKFQSNWNIRTITITFPANASNIVYDPALAAGSSNAAGPTNAATSFAVPSLLLLAIVALFGVLF